MLSVLIVPSDHAILRIHERIVGEVGHVQAEPTHEGKIEPRSDVLADLLKVALGALARESRHCVKGEKSGVSYEHGQVVPGVTVADDHLIVGRNHLEAVHVTLNQPRLVPLTARTALSRTFVATAREVLRLLTNEQAVDFVVQAAVFFTLCQHRPSPRPFK